MKFFSCRVCEERDKRIADLKFQIGYLKAQLGLDNDPARTPMSSLEADGVLSAQQHIIEIPDTAEFAEQQGFKQAEDERYERDRILSGSY